MIHGYLLFAYHLLVRRHICQQLGVLLLHQVGVAITRFILIVTPVSSAWLLQD
jgi:hypothetical protein